MVSLLKMFGKGILYVLGFPFFIVALLLFGIVGIFLFIFQLIKSIIYFFTGQKFFPELPEDKELRLKREAAFMAANGGTVPNDQVFEQETNESPIMSAPAPSQNVYFDEEPAPFVPPVAPIVQEEEKPVYEEPADSYQAFRESTFEAPKEEEPEIPEPEETPEEEPEEPEEPVDLSELTRDEPETTIETAAPSMPEVEEEEELEEYVPRGTAYVEDIEEEDTHSGVDIDYDVR